MKEKSVITITIEDGKLNVKCSFAPASKTEGKMRPTHAAAMVAVEAIAKWAKGTSDE